MTESNDQDRKAPLKLSPGKLELKKTVETGQVRQSFSHGRSKVVTVEVKKKRTFAADAGGALHEVKDMPRPAEPLAAPSAAPVPEAELPHIAHDLTTGEKAMRVKVLQDALKADEESRRRAAEREVERLAAEEEANRLAAELAAVKAAQPQPEPEPAAAPAPAAAAAPASAPAAAGASPAAPAPTTVAASAPAATETEEEDEDRAKRPGRPVAHKPVPVVKRNEPRRREGKLTISAALDEDRGQRGRSLAAVKRARERERLKQSQKSTEKVVREVVIPETISVQELANRMAERSADVIK